MLPGPCPCPGRYVALLLAAVAERNSATKLGIHRFIAECLQLVYTFALRP